MIFLRVDSLRVIVEDVTFQQKPRRAQRGQVAAALREWRVSAAASTLALADRLGEAFCFQTGRGLVSHCAESTCLETIIGDGNRALPTAQAQF